MARIVSTMEGAIADTTASNGVAISLVAIAVSAGRMKALREVRTRVTSGSSSCGCRGSAQSRKDAPSRDPGVRHDDARLTRRARSSPPARSRLCLSRGPPCGRQSKRDAHGYRADIRVRFFRPSGDWLFESASASFGARTVAIVLSGAQDDGARGAVAVRNAGGIVIVQDPATCDYPEMPSAAITTGAVRHVLAPKRSPTASTRSSAVCKQWQ